MKCPTCGAKTPRVRETRELQDGLVLRRARRCQNGHAFATYEIEAISFKALDNFLPNRMRRLRKNIKLWARDQKILARIGTEPLADIGADYGLSASRVGNIAREAGKSQKQALDELAKQAEPEQTAVGLELTNIFWGK